jgi:hypothetical protein
MTPTTPGLYGISAQYRTPSGQLGFIRVHQRDSICIGKIIASIKRNPKRKLAGDLKIYNAERVCT